MFGRLIKWVATVLVIGVVGTVIGWGIPIVIAAAPLWILVVAMMVVAIVLFNLVVWSIKHGGW